MIGETFRSGPEALPVAKDGKLDPIGYQTLLDDMTDQGQIGPPAPTPEKYLDTSYWEEAIKTLN